MKQGKCSRIICFYYDSLVFIQIFTLLLTLLHVSCPSDRDSALYCAPLTQMWPTGWPNQGNRPTSLSSSSSPHPGPPAHERGRPRPMDGRWGVCYVRAPDPDTTQHTALQATTAGLECDLLQTGPCVCETQVEGGGHGWRDVSYRRAHTVPNELLDKLQACWVFCLQHQETAKQHDKARTSAVFPKSSLFVLAYSLNEQ